MGTESEDLISTLVPDPSKPAGLVAFQGFAGKSARGDGWLRLYTSLCLDSFVEIQRGDVFKSVEYDDPPFKRTIAWVPATAKVYPDSFHDLSRYFTGEIAGKSLALHVSPLDKPTSLTC